ncbi:MAG TPA: formate/nitrite transporter family protein [Micropepsaceae bacterium]|jgi:formate/nitrite transporter FocA (FNT family)|nr:formate/nitrite transporter family protein [Micropepsaceae bacterium]
MAQQAVDRDEESKGSELSAVERLPELTKQEKDAVEATSRPNAALIHETIRAEGEAELRRTVSALLLSGLAAGLSMGFSFTTEALLHSSVAPGPEGALISHFGYTVGFLIVVLGRQQLFTENTLTPVLPLLHNRDQETFGRVLRLWAIVLLANLAGACIFAAGLTYTHLFGSDVERSMVELARPLLQFGFGTTVVKAVFAGWLIGLMVWLLPSSEGSRPLIIIILTYVVSLGGFAHVIAGSVDGLFLVFHGEASVADFFARFFFPTLLGNVAGGITLVAALNYGQVAPQLK